MAVQARIGPALGLLTEKQLAAEWHVTVRHLARLRAEAGLPWISMRLPGNAKGAVRYEPEAVRRWLAARAQGDTDVVLEPAGTPARRKPGRPRGQVAR